MGPPRARVPAAREADAVPAGPGCARAQNLLLDMAVATDGEGAVRVVTGSDDHTARIFSAP